MSKKIGILSFHKADNYGAVLQVFALQEVTQNLTQLPVEIIDYKQPYIRNLKPQFPQLRMSIFCVKDLLQSLWRSLLYLTPSARHKRLKFADFRNKYLKMSEVIFNSKKDFIGYTTYITGSDQVWNTAITEGDSTFYLNFGSLEIKRVSYAASFGHNELSKMEKAYVKKYLPNIDFISVREDSAVEMIRSATQIPVSQVLDPTLLLNKKQWLDICGDDGGSSVNYLLLYGLEVNEQMNKIARRIADSQGLQLIKIGGVGLAHTKIKIDKTITDAGPLDYLKFFLNADYIVTNSFHGTAFAINFNKNFICIPHKTRGIRMISLLKLLKLSDRVVPEAKVISEDFKLTVDFTQANEQLQIERGNSLKFLDNALSDESNKI